MVVPELPCPLNTQLSSQRTRLQDVGLIEGAERLAVA